MKERVYSCVKNLTAAMKSFIYETRPQKGIVIYTAVGKLFIFDIQKQTKE